MTTTIEWTDTVWNPTTGCDRVSPGCDHCYALTMAKRLKGMGSAKYQRDGDPRTSGPGFGITEHSDALELPMRWRKPRRVFVNSMSDLFHDGVTDAFIAAAWSVMARTPQHTYQILTKRHGRMRSLLNRPSFRDNLAHDLTHSAPWPLPNVWLGVSVEDQKRANLRVPALLQTPAAVRFLSCEPLLGMVDLSEHLGDPDGPARLHWIIAGGESGAGARPMHPEWPRRLRDHGVPFFFKQWGAWVPTHERVTARDRRTIAVHSAGMTALTADNPFDPFARGHPWWVGMRNVGKHAAGRELDGCTWDEYPAATR